MASNNDEPEAATEKVAAAATDADADLDEAVKTKHLGWTKKQGRILSGGGIVESLPWKFDETELPHYHLLRNETHEYFQYVRKKEQPKAYRTPSLVAGVWERPLFYGGYEQSTSHDEITYNIQTTNLFIDLRIPRTRAVVFRDAIENRKVSNLSDLTPDELRLFARQHVFGGITDANWFELDGEGNWILQERRIGYAKDDTVRKTHATRHHAIDWNFIGVGRPRPNKWWIKCDQKFITHYTDHELQTWEELGFVGANMWSAPYYFERWERHDQGGPLPRLALRKSPPGLQRPEKKQKAAGDSSGPTFGPCLGGEDDYNFANDGIIVIVGDHFNYLFPRKLTPEIVNKKKQNYPHVTSLVDLVDAAVSRGDLDVVRAYLSIEAGHGRISGGPSSTDGKKKHWTVDCAIPFWDEGKQFWDPKNEFPERSKPWPHQWHQYRDWDDVPVTKVMWKGEAWDVYECTLTEPELKEFLMS
mmetsp:Transcript_15808/g.39285  ORF Transcript_15808/g.39285 Transcript_15808/m.39285 type:complete len:473 (+) Transcript_15808:98-1516(+)